MTKNRVLVAMSGGVDSSVAAFLLKEQGFDVVGITMQIWPDDDFSISAKGCCSLSAVEDARRVADHLDIPYYVMNFKELFEKKVITYFINEYISGKTPNPCIACNKYIKFNELINKALQLDFYYVATGHYAIIEKDESANEYLLRKAKDKTKDQTYVLYNMTQYQLEHTIMPIASYTKAEIRLIAEKIGLKIADKPDSQEICFIPDGKYEEYIKSRMPNSARPGNFVDSDGNVIGRHKGIINYTVGQRKGLGISAKTPLYVIKIDPKENLVVLGRQEQLYSDKMVVGNINMISNNYINEPKHCSVKIRYGIKEATALLQPVENGKIEVHFGTPQRAVTPGQAAVFYQNDIVIGGGTILGSSFNN